jgi:CBS domain-containing protein
MAGPSIDSTRCGLSFSGEPDMNVASKMSCPVHMAHRDTLVADIVRLMMRYRVSAVPVVDDEQKILGVVALSDLVPQTRHAPASFVPLMYLQDEWVDAASLPSAYATVGQLPASEVMHDALVTVHPETDIGMAARLMAEHNLHAIPVVRRDGVLVGIVTRSDVARMAIGQEGE